MQNESITALCPDTGEMDDTHVMTHQDMIRESVRAAKASDANLNKKRFRELNGRQARLKLLEQRLDDDIVSRDLMRKHAAHLREDILSTIRKVRLDNTESYSYTGGLHEINTANQQRQIQSVQDDTVVKNAQIMEIIRTTCCTGCMSNTYYIEQILAVNEYNPVVARCPEKHAKCLYCLDNCVSLAGHGPVACDVEGCKTPVFHKDQIAKATKAVYIKYMETVARYNHEIRQSQMQPNLVEEREILKLQETCALRSPCCGMIIMEFGGFCDVKCKHCPAHFCGWCFETFDTPVDLSHTCPSNPDNDFNQGNAYVSPPSEEAKLNLLKAVWVARQFEQLSRALDTTLAEPQKNTR